MNARRKLFFFGKGGVAPAPGVDPDAAAYIARVEDADGQALEPAIKTAINDFVLGVKADGDWDALKASCILAGARTLNGALEPLTGTAPTNFNFVSDDYNRKTGLKGDGGTKYLDSNRANTDDPQNNAHLSANLTAVPSFTTNRFHIGAISTGDFPDYDLSEIGYGVSPDRNLFRLRNGTPVFAGNRNHTGILGVSRSSPSSASARSLGVTNTATNESFEPSTRNYFVFARNIGEASIHSDARLSFYSIGESIDLAALDTRVSSLMTAIDGAIA